MVFKPTSRLHWESKDIKGVVITVHINSEGEAIFVAKNAETGKLIEERKFEHPIEAMNHAATIKPVSEKVYEPQAKETEAVL